MRLSQTGFKFRVLGLNEPSGAMRQAGDSGQKTAAFFDVDGTVVSTTIVHYYVRFRLLLLPRVLRVLWLAGFALKVIYYYLLDKVSRTKFNQVFYQNYRGLKAESVKKLAQPLFDDYILAEIFPAASEHIREHKNRGHVIVLVTGSLDFIVQPLADYLQADCVLAVQLEEVNGKFTGNLTTPPLGEQEKAHAVRAFAQQHDINLARSHAYGDSRADVPMLRCVGNPVVVNPGKALQQTAEKFGWNIQAWTLKKQGLGDRKE